MLKVPEFLKYPEWYEINKEFENQIGHNDKRYIIKEDAPDFIKKSYEEYLNKFKEQDFDDEYQNLDDDDDDYFDDIIID